jgi:hypothetical protein
MAQENRVVEIHEVIQLDDLGLINVTGLVAAECVEDVRVLAVKCQTERGARVIGVATVEEALGAYVIARGDMIWGETVVNKEIAKGGIA